MVIGNGVSQGLFTPYGHVKGVKITKMDFSLTSPGSITFIVTLPKDTAGSVAEYLRHYPVGLPARIEDVDVVISGPPNGSKDTNEFTATAPYDKGHLDKLSTVIGKAATAVFLNQVLSNLWFTPVERRWGNLEQSLAWSDIDALELQRRADISQHAAKALLKPTVAEIKKGDLVFLHVNAIVTCEGKKIGLPRTSMGRVTAVRGEGLEVEVFHPEKACRSEILTTPMVLEKIDVADACAADPKSEAGLRYRVYMFLKDLSQLHLLPVPSQQGFGPLASLVDGFRGLRALGLSSKTNVKVYADEATFEKIRKAFPRETVGWERDGTTAIDWATADDLSKSSQCKKPEVDKRFAEGRLAFSSQFPQTVCDRELSRRLKWCIQNTFSAANFIAGGPYSWINQNRPMLLADDTLREAAIPFNSVWQFPVRFEHLSQEFAPIAEAAYSGLIELMVCYGLHTLHQVGGQERPKLQRIAYAEGNLALAAHKLDLDKPIVIFSFCPATPPEGVGRCSDMPEKEKIQAEWLERKQFKDMQKWLTTLSNQRNKGKVVIVYYEKSAASSDIQGIAHAATLPNGYEGASFGRALQVQRKSFFSFWDLPGEGTALPQGAITPPGEYLVLNVDKIGHVETHHVEKREPIKGNWQTPAALERLLDVTEALNPNGSRKAYMATPPTLEQPEELIKGVSGLYSAKGADVIKCFLQDAKTLNAADPSPGALHLAKYYIETWNLAENYKNDMALQLLKELLKEKNWKL